MKSLGSARPGAVVAALFTLVACSEGSAVPDGMGGSAVSTSGAGGMTASGGRAGTGGGATGGNGGVGGGGSAITRSFSFTGGLEGFAVNYYCTAAPGATEPGTNCVQVDAAPAPVVDAGVNADAGDAGALVAPPIANDFVALAHDLEVGSPDLGSARLTIQFSAVGQQAQLAFNTPNTDADAINMAGKTVRAQVMSDVAGASAKMYLKSTGTYVYADAGQVALVPGAWTTLTFNAMAPSFMNAGYVATDIRELGISFETTTTTLTPTTIHVDTVEY